MSTIFSSYNKKKELSYLQKFKSTIPKILLNSNHEIPAIGFGTSFPADYTDIEFLIEKALDVGYRYFDLMQYGFNAERILKVIQRKIESRKIKREDLFIASKLWITERKPSKIAEQCKSQLRTMHLDYFDLFIVDWPFSTPDDVDIVDVWMGMEDCVDSGFASSIGVSNFSIQQLDRLIETRRTSILPSVMQAEMHLYLNQDKLLRYCRSRNVQVVAHSPLGAPDRNHLFRPPGPINIDYGDRRIRRIAQKYGKTPHQVALRHCIDQGAIPIPKTCSGKHLQENLNVFDFKLTSEEKYTLKTLNRNLRTCTAKLYSTHREYPFRDSNTLY